MTSQLPMFPLNTVLFPGVTMPLHVFEDRYRALVHHLLTIHDRSERLFGVVAIRQGAEVGAATTYDCGTSAEIVDWHQEESGLLGIVAAARRSLHAKPTALAAE